jgi:tetrahydromethanopterin S-methyltransferase subunit B
MNNATELLVVIIASIAFGSGIGFLAQSGYIQQGWFSILMGAGGSALLALVIIFANMVHEMRKEYRLLRMG